VDSIPARLSIKVVDWFANDILAGSDAPIQSINPGLEGASG